MAAKISSFISKELKSAMKVVGLVSGGKDSVYNLLQCIAAGHEIVALANIYPAPDLQKNELDSFMFQTVGHEGINLIASAIGVPLYRQATNGVSQCQKLSYQPVTSDEVEDLYTLLRKVKEETGCQGVAVGAIASDYQRLRVENVCSRLGLTSLAYMWHQDQSFLLENMIKTKIDAITIKVASMGLKPDQHLGVNITDLEPILRNLSKKYGVNVCGEGGEYETFVLDCPLFHKRIVIEEKEIIGDSDSDIGASGYCFIKSARLEDKFDKQDHSDTLQERLKAVIANVPSPDDYVKSLLQKEECKVNDAFVDIYATKRPTGAIYSRSGVYVHNITSKDVESAVGAIRGYLQEMGLSLSDIVFVGLWLQDMRSFAEVNEAYVNALPGLAPARACVAVPLTSEYPIVMEVIASPQVDGLLFVAGQIPLVPGSMVLFDGPLDQQVSLSVRHVERILQAMAADLNNIIMLTIFVAQKENLQPALDAARQSLPRIDVIVTGACVTALPRYANVEVLAVACENVSESKQVFSETVSIQNINAIIEVARNGGIVALSCQVEKSERCDESTIREILDKCLVHSDWELGFRILYDNVGLQEIITGACREYSISIIPVVGCGEQNRISIAGLGYVK